MDTIKAMLKEHLSETELRALPNTMVEFARIVKTALISNPANTGASVDKGKRGEKYVRGILKKYQPVMSLRNHAGDILVDNICIEVKDYTANVPKSEIDKFIKDLNSTNVSAGLFISLSSPITNIDSMERRCEVIGGRKVPIMFIATDNVETIQLATELLLTECKACVYSTLDYTLREDLFERIDVVMLSLKGLKESRDMLNKMLVNTTNTVNTVHQSIVSTEAVIRANLDAIRGDYRTGGAVNIDEALDLRRFKKIANKDIVERIAAQMETMDGDWQLTNTTAKKAGFGLVFGGTATKFLVLDQNMSDDYRESMITDGFKLLPRFNAYAIDVTSESETLIMELLES